MISTIFSGKTIPVANLRSRVFFQILTPTIADETKKGNTVINILSGCSPVSSVMVLIPSRHYRWDGTHLSSKLICGLGSGNLKIMLNSAAGNGFRRPTEQVP